MKVLITGGTGFIGSRLVRRCLEQGHEVRLLAQANNEAERDNLRALERLGAETRHASVTDRDAVHQAVAGCDRVFHLAAAQHEANVPESHFWNVNVEGTRHLLDAAVAAGIRRFVHGSTIGVYGSAMDGEIDERSPLRPDNIYGVTKKAGEELALSYRERLPLCVVRISETYGPGDRRLLKLFKAVRSPLFFMIGRGHNKHQLIYVDDLVEGLCLAATHEAAVGEVFVLAGSEVVDTNRMVTTVARAMGAPERRRRMPLWPFLGAAVVMEKTLAPLGIQPPLHRRRMDFFRKSFYFSQQKAERLLGFRAATPFAAGVERTAAWYREQGLV